jgi:hypothetical protein
MVALAAQIELTSGVFSIAAQKTGPSMENARV